MKRIINFIDNLNLRIKLLCTYIILITIPIAFLGLRYFSTSTDVILDISSKNAYELVKKSNEVIDAKLSEIVNNMSVFATDKDVVSAISEIKPTDDYNANNKIPNLLDKYFSLTQDVYSAQLVTSSYIYGLRSLEDRNVKSLVTKSSLLNSEVYSIAKEQAGNVQWIPTYDFGKMFNLSYYDGANVDNKYVFSAVTVVMGKYYVDGYFSSLAENVEKPVLVLLFKENFFRDIYKNSIPVDGSYFFVVTRDGQIVSSQDQSMITTKISKPWLNRILKKDNGRELFDIDGEKRIVCYNTSKVTGWVSVAVIPAARLVEPVVSVIRPYTVYSSIILGLLSIFVAYFVSIKITQPISKLIKATKNTGEGNFDLKMKEEGGKESKELIQRFNIMNDKIQKLIEENYETKIKEKDAEIMALNLQLDPHFMYNTINLISLISIENGQEEVSEMLISLSTMLKYTVKARKDLVSFKEDMDYLKSYIFIMTKRFEGRFIVEYEIDSSLYECRVPKFFLQPFVENALIHGFKNMERVGNLKIQCREEDGLGIFKVADNGNGIDPGNLERIMEPDGGSIGINNVDKRIKIIFGHEYGVKINSELGKGTLVTITMPIRKEKV